MNEARQLEFDAQNMHRINQLMKTTHKTRSWATCTTISQSVTSTTMDHV